MATPRALPAPTRRPHPKSRLGCMTCKKRRCDQTRPSCRNCTKRGLQCDTVPVVANDCSLTNVSKYLAREGLSGVLVLSITKPVCEISARPLASTPLLDMLLHDGFLQNIPEALESRLRHSLHHFINATSATLAVDGPTRSAWPEAILRFAARYPFVVHGILALASLHLSRYMVNEAEKGAYLTTAIEQLNRGLVQYRQEIEDVKNTNAEALFCFSSIASSWVPATLHDECQVLLCAMKNGRQSESQRRENMSAIVQATTKILRISRGVLIILIPHWDSLEQGLFGPLMKKQWPDPIPASPRAIDEDRKLDALQSLWTKTSTCSEDHVKILNSALEKLRDNFALVSQLTLQTPRADGTYTTALADWTSVLVWITQIPSAFCSLLENQVPQAWVIYAHYAMLPAKVRDIWWLEAMPSDIVSTAALVLGDDAVDPIGWPARCVGVDLESFRKSS